jgi:cyclophilin family peptidyl-prolyl cis-trans isomerase
MRRVSRAPDAAIHHHPAGLDGSGGRRSSSSSSNTAAAARGPPPVVSPIPNHHHRSPCKNHNNNHSTPNSTRSMLLGNLPSVPIGFDDDDDENDEKDNDYCGGNGRINCLDHGLLTLGNGGGGGGGGGDETTSDLSRRRGGSSKSSRSQQYRNVAQQHRRWIKIVFFIILLSALFLAFQYYESQHDIQLRQALERDEFQPATEDLLEKLHVIKEQRAVLQKQMDAERVELAQLRKRTTEDIPTLQQQLTQLQEQSQAYKQQMHAAIQHLSRRRLVEKFGAGPYYVIVDLAFDPLANVPGDQHFIAMELASANDMPHSIYTFLEQVSNHLYDGTSFHRNAGHIVQCGPAINFLSPPGIDYVQRFVNAGLEHVLFPEYSANYPHYKYTIGFGSGGTGAVGEWYINIRDNRELHGPGGQRNRPDAVADPCFGRVIDGFETVNRLHQSPVMEGLQQRSMEHNVAITKMTFMTQETFDHWKMEQQK